MHKVAAKCLLVPLAILAASACGGGSPTEPRAANVAGTWDASVSVTGGTRAPAGTTFAAVLTISQAGSSLTGTFSATGGGGGQLSGSVRGQQATFILQQVNPCAGSYQGTGLVSGGSMTGTYGGQDCLGTTQVSFTAIRR